MVQSERKINTNIVARYVSNSSESAWQTHSKTYLAIRNNQLLLGKKDLLEIQNVPKLGMKS